MANSNAANMVISEPDIMGGVPVIRGTRIPVYVILENLEQGHSYEDILQDYPSLDRESIRGAIHYAAELCGAA
jgi:uncharacterized protein (DUF433 family)